MKSAILALAAALSLSGAGLRAQELLTGESFFGEEQNTGLYRIRGVVADTFRDDADPRFVYFTLDCGGRMVLVSVKTGDKDPSRALSLPGRRAELLGAVRTAYSIMSRSYLGKMFTVDGMDGVKLLGDDPDPFGVPELELREGMRPDEIDKLGRRRVKGRVIASWGGRNALIAQKSGRPARVSFSANDGAPAYGQQIEAVGNAATDTYNITLTHARWRACGEAEAQKRDPKPATIRELLFDEAGNRRFQAKFHGAAICISGTVRGTSDIARGRFEIEDGGGLVTVDASSLPGLPDGIARGCTVRVSGTCVLDVEMWSPGELFPRIRGFLVVPNEEGDVVVTAKAPWLTPARAWTVFAALAAFAIAVVLWNRILWLRAFRSGKALADEEVARAEADIRTHERTRLAVELHDSIVQNLAGVIMEVETAKRMIADPSGEPLVHLERAEKAMRSCHADLRNCLWDLRSEALEESDMSQAIRTTLLPHLKDATIDVRFGVPRSLLSDNTAYTILRIIRELALNGMRHGGAKHLKVAGATEGGVLRFSVRDDGSGFDPSSVPGVTEGHFGLEGIRQRVRNLSGKFEIARSPEGGMRAVVTIPIPSCGEDK